eukprot:SAG22_NODE_17259_length_308_cov_0.980861_1_plen_33_part_10
MRLLSTDCVAVVPPWQGCRLVSINGAEVKVFTF